MPATKKATITPVKKKIIKKDLAALKGMSKDKLIEARYNKIRAVGIFKE